MDKLNKYRQLIQKLLQEYANKLGNTTIQNVELHTVFDEKNDRYIVYRTGWWNMQRIHSAILYLRIFGDKIWIEEDGTEEGIATELLIAGVPNEDIVLGFRHPELRPLTEFATV